MALAALMLAAAAANSARAVSVTEFPAGADEPQGPIVQGPDGNLWFAEEHSIGRITPAGQITQFTEGLLGSKPQDITVGSDGNLWFTATDPAAIGRITPSGAITKFTGGLNPESAPANMTLGSDGDIWFLDLGTPTAIGRAAPNGTITEFSEGLGANSKPNDITEGPNGDLWFTDEGDTKAIGRVTSSGDIKEFGTGEGSFPAEITAGADGNVWFSDDGLGAVGRVKPGGEITEFGEESGLQMNGAPDAVIAGPDGNIWFTDQYSERRAVGRITPAGVITEFDNGLSNGVPDDITVGADGNLWIEQSTPGSVARITPAGVITEFTAGFDPMGGEDGDEIISGPDRNLWFTDRGTPKAIGRVDLELPTLSGGGPGGGSGGGTPPGTVTSTVNGTGTPTTTPPSGGPVPANAKIAVSGFSETASRWRLGSLLPQISSAAVGTTFSFSLNAPANLALTFTHSVPGRRAKGKCVAPSHKNATRPKCQRTVIVGSLGLSGHAGLDKIRFQGRLSSTKKLKPGNYHVTITTRSGSGQKALTRSLAFTILR